MKKSRLQTLRENCMMEKKKRRWKPMLEKKYVSIQLAKSHTSVWLDDAIDKKRFKEGRVFPNKKSAWQAIKCIHAYLTGRAAIVYRRRK